MSKSKITRDLFFRHFNYPHDEERVYLPLEDIRNHFVQDEDDILIQFAQNLLNANGEFYYAESVQELSLAINSLLNRLKVTNVYCTNDELLSLFNTQSYIILNEKDDLSVNEVTIAECEFLCARTGSVVMSSFLSTGRRALFTNDVLVIVARTNQVVYDIEDALLRLTSKYRNRYPSLVTFITGPSRTADIEKEIVLGAQASKRLIVFLYEET
ncbi:MAG: lactate utilization protein [Bacteroidales bacterium]|nr:lactate utilization protein [Bacteroidales bacterium]